MQLLVDLKYIELQRVDITSKIVQVFLNEDLIRLMDEYEIKLICLRENYIVEINVYSFNELSQLDKLRKLSKMKFVSKYTIPEEVFFEGDRLMEFKLSLE